jgi:hypothetical protein
VKNIIEESVRKDILERISKISGNEKAKWGKMNVHEMVVHCSDQLRMSMGLKETEYVGKPVIGIVLKRLVLMGLPIPKGKAETAKELKQGVGGTKPVDLENDKAALIKLINEFNISFQNVALRKHPFFGDMNFSQWGKLVYIHTEHHLNQFNR